MVRIGALRCLAPRRAPAFRKLAVRGTVDGMTASGTPLARLLGEIHWRPERLAERLNRFAQRHGRPERIHPKTPYKWQSGDCPRAPWPTLICALLSERLQRIINPADLGWPDDGTELVPATAGLHLPWTGAGALQAGKVVTDGGGMYRRVFLLALGAPLTEPGLEWLLAHPAGDLSSRSGHPLPMDVVDCLDLMTDGLRRMDDQLGGRQTLGLVRQHLGTVLEMLENRRYSESVGRRLHATAGELLRLGGWLLFDSGQHAPAQRYWTAGLYAAHASHDRALGANILGFMSCQAKDIGQIREAVTLAETARRGYHGSSPQVAAILDLRAAEAFANAGDADRTRDAIDTAMTRFGDKPGSAGNPAWSYWITPEHADAQAGYSYLKLGDWARARTHLRRTQPQHQQQSMREGALRAILLATTYLHQENPDLDRACNLGSQAVATLSGQVDSPRCVRHLRTLTEDLRPHRRVPTVRAFCADAADLLHANGAA